MKNHKWLCWLAVLVILAGIGTAAVRAADAAAETTLPEKVFSAVEQLMFHTHNVTISGEAVFSLDGERFKTARLTYLQDRSNSSMRVQLSTPRKSGEQETGFLVIANGQYIYAIEDYTPGIYKTGTDAAQTTPVRRTAQMDQMTELIRQVIGILPDDGAGIFTAEDTEDGGQRITIKVAEGSVTPMENAVFGAAAQYAVRRLFRVDAETIDEQQEASIADYVSVTSGILGTTRTYSLISAEAEVNIDAEGRLAGVRGSIAVGIDTARDGQKRIDVTFEGSTSAWGETKVGLFSAEEYGVKLAPGYGFLDPDPALLLAPVDEDLKAELIRNGMDCCISCGYTGEYVKNPEMYHVPEEVYERYTVSMYDEETGDLVEMQYTPSMELAVLQNYHGEWLINDGAEAYRLEPSDPEKTEKAREAAMNFLQKYRPDLAVNQPDLQFDWEYESPDGELYIRLFQSEEQEPDHPVSFVVRVSDGRIEFMSTIPANG